jgi:hypothetical protein
VSGQLEASHEGFSSTEIIIGIIKLFKILFRCGNSVNKIHPSFEAMRDWRYKMWKY